MSITNFAYQANTGHKPSDAEYARILEAARQRDERLARKARCELSERKLKIKRAIEEHAEARQLAAAIGLPFDD